ncbi:MAG: hypothetical protein R6V30_12195 [Paracoccaceae bacterium]
MPLKRLLLILALAITAAGLTIWVGLWLQGATGQPDLWVGVTGALVLALILRVLLQPK